MVYFFILAWNEIQVTGWANIQIVRIISMKLLSIKKAGGFQPPAYHKTSMIING
jgi:hypothetical protein